MPISSGYRPPHSEIWHGRSDGALAKRIHEGIELIDLEALPNTTILPGYGIIGFACDEGVRRNQGRVGAAEGPEAIRKALSSLPFPGKKPIYDCGNIICLDGDLERAQERLGEAVAMIMQFHLMPIVLGGGHELAWGHYQGISKALPNVDLSIVNFDAHFDLRPLLKDGKGHSGCSFRQIADDCLKRQKPFNYTCLGIQSCSNTQDLFIEAKRLGVHVVQADEFHLGGVQPALEAVDSLLTRCEAIYLTICLDVFAAPFAPGVSAPQPLGILPWQLLPIIKRIASSGHLVGLDFAELCPPYDNDARTARLAAQLLYHLLL